MVLRAARPAVSQNKHIQAPAFVVCLVVCLVVRRGRSVVCDGCVPEGGEDRIRSGRGRGIRGGIRGGEGEGDVVVEEKVGLGEGQRQLI